MSTYKSEAEIHAIVQGFESCTTYKTAFKHSDHLIVATCYLQDLTVEQATEKMRAGLLRFVDHHKVDRRKYNETITVFWLEMVAAALRGLTDQASLVERCNYVIDSLNNGALPAQYYSNDLLLSDAARKTFVEPDLKDWRKG